MSQENVKRVRSILEQFSGIDATEVDFDSSVIREMLERDYSPDVELLTLASGVGRGVREYYRGRDDLIRYFREWLDPFSEYRAEALDYIEAGLCVLVPSRQWGIGDGSGPEWRSSSPPSTSFVRGRSCGWRSTTRSKKPSKPPGCGSRRCGTSAVSQQCCPGSAAHCPADRVDHLLHHSAHGQQDPPNCTKWCRDDLSDTAQTPSH